MKYKKDKIKTFGPITLTIKYKSGLVEQHFYHNQLLNGGRRFQSGNLIPRSDSVYIKNWLFGDGGTADGKVKEVLPETDQLFGVVHMKKEVVGQIDKDNPGQAFFTVIVPFEEGNDFTLNEMALELSDGSLYSLTTFADFNKNDEMELSWLWEIYFV